MHWYEDNLAEIVTFEMGEQAEPLFLKILRILGYCQAQPQLNSIQLNSNQLRLR